MHCRRVLDFDHLLRALEAQAQKRRALAAFAPDRAADAAQLDLASGGFLLRDHLSTLRRHFAEARAILAAAYDIGDLQAARDFYVDAIGFETTQAGYPGAVFASAGGYHHHVAMNTWNSRGAGPRAASLGLGDVSVTVPGRDDLDALVARLRAHNLSFADDGRSVVVNDPWGTQVTVALPDLSTDELLAQ